jgi:murein DD-endopeptidase MepM/ murein hydrolase activator NlpD
MVLCFALGGAIGFWIHARMNARGPDVSPAVPIAPVPTSGRAAGEAPRASPGTDAVPIIAADPIGELRRHGLRLPLDSASVASMKGGFEEHRDGNARHHEAVDLPAARNSPVHAVEAGTIAKLFFSRAGGTTVYQFDPTGKFCYYYAHLERYAESLHEGQTVAAGDVIGYVGTSGNAPPSFPHLHFAIFQLTGERHWWQGTAIDPYRIFEP